MAQLHSLYVFVLYLGCHVSYYTKCMYLVCIWVVLGFWHDPHTCQHVGGMAPCSLTVLHLTIVYTSVVYPNSSILMYNGHLPINASVNSWVLDDIFKQPLYSLLQAVDTCIRVELGNPRPNNFILNPSFLNKSISSKFPTTQWNTDIINYENYIVGGPNLIQYSSLTLRSSPQEQQISKLSTYVNSRNVIPWDLYLFLC